LNKKKIGIVGGTGYTGSELLRLLLQHDNVEVICVTSRKLAGKLIYKTHPNLKGYTDLKFVSVEELIETDILFLCLPHGATISNIDHFVSKTKILIDLSSDFRLKSIDDYKLYYNMDHNNPDLLKDFIYGMPELHRNEIKNATRISVPGCTATGAIIPLKPLVENFSIKNIVVDAKVGSSASGAHISQGTHHPERQGVVRSYKPSMHRHIAEMQQELNKDGKISMNFSPHAVELVRGIQSTIHIFMENDFDERDIWQAYLKYYKDEPFVRFIREKSGGYRFPEPKIVMGTNLCDIGFEKDPLTGRLIVISAIDNLVKGAAGQAIQCMNICTGLDESTGLNQLGFHPI